MSDPIYLTAEGRTRLAQELEQLTKVERSEVASRIEVARELGDLSENADYEAAKNDQAFLEGRIALIEHQLRFAVLIDEDVKSGKVEIGSKVTVLDPDGEEMDFTIVGSAESDPKAQRISNESPLGKALLGHAAGDEVMVKAPAGEMVYKVISIG